MISRDIYIDGASSTAIGTFAGALKYAQGQRVGASRSAAAVFGRA